MDLTRKKTDKRQYSFRIPEHRTEQWEEIEGKIEKVHDLLKRYKKPKEFTTKKSDIAIEALGLGIDEILEKLEKDKENVA